MSFFFLVMLNLLFCFTFWGLTPLTNTFGENYAMMFPIYLFEPSCLKDPNEYSCIIVNLKN